MLVFDFIFGLVAFVGILLALLVGGTFLTLVVKGSRRLLGTAAPMPGLSRVGQRACPNTECRQINPAHARYCRRCGQSMV